MFCIVLRVKTVLCCEHWQKIDRFLDSIMNEMGVSSHKGKYTGHLFALKYICKLIYSVNSDVIIILREVMYWIYHAFTNVHLIISS